MDRPARACNVAAATLALVLATTGGLALPLAAQDDGPLANRGCYGCHSDPEEVMVFDDGSEVSIGLDKRVLLESAHGRLECTACHVGLEVFEHSSLERPAYPPYRARLAKRCQECHTRPGEKGAIEPPIIEQTLHPQTGSGFPLCIDCHAPHSVMRSNGGRTAVSRACADCHEETYATFAASVHRAGVLEEGNRDSPACVDCHRGHSEVGNASTIREIRLGQPCMTCHDDADLMGRYGISTNVVSTYLSDFHGVSVRFYDEADADIGRLALVCSDCHGIHDVATVAAGNPLLMKENLLRVCRECHADASESFPDAWLSHYEPSLEKAPLVYLIRLAYWIFIPFVILGLSLQIFAHLVLFPRRRRKTKTGSGPEIRSGDEKRMVQRFGRRHRIEHLLVMVTFVLLLLTGLPQKFWDTGWAVTLTGLFGGIDMMRAIHRVTGIVFTVLCVVHLVAALCGVLAGKTGMSIVPKRKDFRDAVQNLKYYMGLAKEQPKFDRYDYRQKFEYWGMMIGSAVMILSGFVLYFPILFAQYLPGEFIPAAKAAHTYEAMMALLTIVVWHMYGAHLNPECFPLDRSIFTGKISLRRMKHEHALEYEREKDKIAIADAPPEGRPASDEPAPSPTPP